MKDPFGPGIKFKIAWWRARNWMLYHHRFMWYVIGIIMGWIVCSEYNIWLNTGKWTWFPWQ